MTTITESTVEDAALAWLESLGWNGAHGPDIAPDTPGAERSDYGVVVLERRLRDTLARLNPNLPTEAQDDAFRKLLHLGRVHTSERFDDEREVDEEGEHHIEKIRGSP